MSMAIGRGLSALGGGMVQWGGDMRARREREEALALQRQEKEEETALRLQLAGYRPAQPRQAPAPQMGEVEPMAAPLGAAAAAMTGGPTGSALGVPVAELARALSSVRRPSMPEQQEPGMPSRPPVTLGGTSYEFDPTATPEYQKEALQRSLREPGNRRAYQQIAATFDGIGEYNPEVDYAQVYQSNMGTALRRRPDPARNREAYDMVPADAFPGGRKPAYSDTFDWAGAASRYVGGEMGQQNRTEFRVMFPPNSDGDGDGGKDATVAQGRTLNLLQDAASTLVRASGGDARRAVQNAQRLDSPYRQYFANPNTRSIFFAAIDAAADDYRIRAESAKNGGGW